MMTSLGRKEIYSRVHVCLLHIVISNDYDMAGGSTICSSTIVSVSAAQMREKGIL